MTPLVPIVMFGWILVAILLFTSLSPPKAVVSTVVFGFLLLPMATYDLPVIPEYNKAMAIAIGLLLGGALSGSKNDYPIRWEACDVLMMVYCFACPIITSLDNGLGLYNGLSDLVKNYLSWGVVYWAGRRYFTNPASIRAITWGIMIGGLLYVPLVFFEVRMSPKLNVMIYGFFPHSFAQHIRYGGYRPIVFMQHGLMVALWMAASSIVTFSLWWTKKVTKVWGIPILVVFFALVVATLLCKSGNGWFFLIAGLVISLYYATKKNTKGFKWLLIFIPVYIGLRLSGIVSLTNVQNVAGRFFDVERIDSLTWRLLQEDLFGQRALLRPLFGWGGFNRGWPVNPETGQQVLAMVDSLWVILFSGNGFLGLVSLFLAIGIGPWRVMKAYRRPDYGNVEEYSVDAVALALVVTFFLLDSLLNAMVSPVYILASGALLSYSQTIERDRKTPHISDTEGSS